MANNQQMTRFQYKRPESTDTAVYFPFYTETWTTYDPNNTFNCTHGNSWPQIWEHDAERDKLHRQNSYYYRRHEDSDDAQESPTLIILLYGSLIFCLFVPQIIDLLLTFFCPGPQRPPSPATPPPGPKSRKRLRLYHYAQPGKTRYSKGRNAATSYYYDPENILNYVSATRIRTLKNYEGELDFDEDADGVNNNNSNNEVQSNTNL